MTNSYNVMLVLFLSAIFLGGLSMVYKKKSLDTYTKKRDFTKTPEPSGKKTKKTKDPIFVVQKHDASHLHYDFRLEVDGVLVSWAVPKGPSTNPGEKHLAVMTEDHPLDYATFEGIIPQGEYGGGTVMVWDIGTYDNAKKEYGISMEQAIKEGKVEVELHGQKLKGRFALIRTHLNNDARNWLLFKMKDEGGQKKAAPKINEKSVLTKRTLKQIAQEQEPKK